MTTIPDATVNSAESPEDFGQLVDEAGHIIDQKLRESIDQYERGEVEFHEPIKSNR